MQTAMQPSTSGQQLSGLVVPRLPLLHITRCRFSVSTHSRRVRRSASHQPLAFTTSQTTSRERQGDGICAVGPYCIWPQAQSPTTASSWHGEVGDVLRTVSVQCSCNVCMHAASMLQGSAHEFTVA